MAQIEIEIKCNYYITLYLWVCKLNMDNTKDLGNLIYESQMLLNEDENDVGFVMQNSFKESLVESDSSFDFNDCNDNNMRIEDFSENEMVLSCSKIEEKSLTDMGIDEFLIAHICHF